MENSLANEKRKLSNLKNYKNKSESEIEQIAQINCWKKQLAIADRFDKNDEKKLSENLLDNYFDNYTFANYNQVSLLGTLIYEEVLLNRVEKSINTVTKDETNKFVPDKAITALHEIQDRIAQLKENLGISKSKEKDDLTALETLQKKFSVYIPFNRNEFSLVTPCCGKMLLLRRRVKDFDVMVHPYFSGRYWYSPRIINDVIAGILTKEQAAKYLYTSSEYIQWAIDNRNKIVSIDSVDQKVVDEFVASNPFLKDKK